jgi:hypothetical protein
LCADLLDAGPRQHTVQQIGLWCLLTLLYRPKSLEQSEPFVVIHNYNLSFETSDLEHVVLSSYAGQPDVDPNTLKFEPMTESA